MNCYNSSGFLVERYQRLFTHELFTNCSDVNESLITIPGAISNVTIPPPPPPPTNGTSVTVTTNITTAPNGSVTTNTSTSPNTTGGSSRLLQAVNTSNTTNSTPPVVISPPPISTNATISTSNNTVHCCDYFEKGAGYEFSVCDGIGAIIRADLIGGVNDVLYAKMQVNNDLSPIWTDLGNLLNNYCESRSNNSNNTNSSSDLAIAKAWPNLNLPWAEWQQDALVVFGDVTAWLGRFQQYLAAASSFQSSLPGGSLLSAVEQELASVDPRLNFTGITYGELVTDYNQIYSAFVSWYNAFFGPNGLVTLHTNIV
jgi:hypothetical protein